MSTEAIAAPLVLVVADDRHFEAALGPVCADAGLTVARAHAGFAAHEVALRLLPDAILIGPAADEAEAVLMIEQFRLDAPTRHTPILVVTTTASRRVVDRMTAAGATAILPQPVSPDGICQAVRRNAQLAPAAREVLLLRRHLARLRDKAASQAESAVAMRIRTARLFARLQATKLAILAAESNGDCVAVNAAACALTGRAREDLLDRKVWAATGRESVLRDGWPQLLETGLYETRLVVERADGTSAPAAVYATTHVVPGVHVVTLDTGE